jgi:hypothetical protein
MREKSRRKQQRKISSFDKEGHVKIKKTCGLYQDQKREKNEAKKKGGGNVSKRRVPTVVGLAATTCVQRELAGSKVMVERDHFALFGEMFIRAEREVMETGNVSSGS